MRDKRSLDNVLAAGEWARGLSTEQLKRVCETSIARDVPCGNHVCHKGDLSDYWIGVIEGQVKVTSLSGAGKSVTFEAFPANSWFGEGSIIKKEARKYDVIALRDSRVALMPAATFLWLLGSSIDFNLFIVKQLNERLGRYIGAFERDRLDDTETRVARTVADMLHPQLYPNRDGRIEITNEELGHIVGVSRQSVNQALGMLERCGLIKLEYRAVTVLDADGLRNFNSYDRPTRL
jgi:CRP-like cAMP-binding protein